MSTTIITLEKTLSFAAGERNNDSHHQFLITLTNEDHEKNHHCKCDLVGYDSLPGFMKHNEFILGYYRSEWPLKQTILSIFSVHNETLNIWTHLIGFFIFLALAATMMVSVDTGSAVQAATGLSSPINDTSSSPLKLLTVLTSPSPQATNETTNEISSSTLRHLLAPRWPFYSYLAGAMVCLLASCACHLLACHSEHTCYLMLRLDYSGISALIVTSFYPLVYYTFMCHPFIRNLYMGFVTVCGVASILASLVPVFERPEFRAVRTGLFACMAMSGLVPITHKMVAFGDQPEAVITTMYEVAMLAVYGFGVVVYALRIPERWLPGKFDLVGHSHQLWHVLVIAGAYTHYLAGLVYLSWRDVDGCCVIS